jgi:DNA-binding MarR family transcriptional regulator
MAGARRVDAMQQIGGSMREIRRGTAMLRLRALVLGGGEEALELGGSDTLGLLSERGASRMSELADAMRVDASTATRAVARLERAGLVERAPSPDDRRVVVVVPTEAGVAAHLAMRERYEKVMALICKGFDDAELRQLASLMERLVAGLDALPAPGQPAATGLP